MGRFTCLTFSLLFLLSWSSFVHAQTTILNLRHWTAPDHTRVVIDTDQETEYEFEKSKKKISLKFKDAVMAGTVARKYILQKPAINGIVIISLPNGKVSVDLLVADKVDANVFRLKKFQDKPYRIVVDIIVPGLENEQSRAREKIKDVKKDKIIVIDPGHGGEDPGAIGRGGTQEKDVVLEIGKKLRDVLNAGQGTKAFLTREGDYYVTFKKRLGIARQLGADMFISVHADAAWNRKARGSSVYCLSNGGASSEAARILAQNENLSDVIGGSIGEGKSNDDADPILLDMFQNNTINQSKDFAVKVIQNMGKINDIKFSIVQEAPFRVLKLPEIPAVLLETAFISNPDEEHALRSKEFQQKVAYTVADTIREYFSLPESMQTQTVIAVKEAERKTKDTGMRLPKAAQYLYKVKKGDTLTRIAEKYNKNVSDLLKLNDMKLQDTLYAGKMIRIAEAVADGKRTEGTQKAPQKKRTEREKNIAYKVQKGDSLSIIAGKYKTEVSVLLRMNDMKLDDTLYADRTIQVPPTPY